MFPTLAASNIKFLKTVVQHTWKTQKKGMSQNKTYLPAVLNNSPAKSRKQIQINFFNWNFSTSPTWNQSDIRLSNFTKQFYIKPYFQ